VSLSQLITSAQSGGVISFPTDTVPALAALPSQSELIFIAKQRQQDKPLILMGASAEDLWPYIQGSKEEFSIWAEVTAKYWPGQLTLILPASPLVPTVMNPLAPDSIGIRVPDSVLAREILASTGPLATTSANLSGHPPLLSAVEIDRAFPDVSVLNLNPFPVASGQPSTVAKWRDKAWMILRQGQIIL
jgi:L-threonylcarbamoyladenylate synthase